MGRHPDHQVVPSLPREGPPNRHADAPSRSKEPVARHLVDVARAAIVLALVIINCVNGCHVSLTVVVWALPTTVLPGVMGPWLPRRRCPGTCRAGRHRGSRSPCTTCNVLLYRLSEEQNSGLKVMTESGGGSTSQKQIKHHRR
jgi:hypothetical protein